MRPVELALKMVELLSVHQPAGVSELARLAGLPKSTAQRSLMALQKSGWIETGASERHLWSLSMKAILASGRAGRHQAGLRNLAVPVMEELRRATQETIHLTYRFQSSMVLIERLDGIKPVRHFFAYGTVYDLHATASGKAVLASLPIEELEDYLSQPLAASTSQTITNAQDLRDELKDVRERGFAVTFGGNVADVNAVGSVIRDRGGRPIGALSISAPAERLTPDIVPHYGLLVADAARRVSIGVTALI